MEPTEIYAFDFDITTDAPGRVNAIKVLIPGVSDNRVYTHVTRKLYQYHEWVDEVGFTHIVGCIRFGVKADRDGVLNSIRGLEGVIRSCKPGSFIGGHRCFNHLDSPPQLCDQFEREVAV